MLTRLGLWQCDNHVGLAAILVLSVALSLLSSDAFAQLHVGVSGGFNGSIPITGPACVSGYEIRQR